jgi:hypothetical protein
VAPRSWARASQAVGRDVEAAQHAARRQQRVHGGALVGLDEARVDPPARGQAVAAGQLAHPLRGGGHLQAADLVEAGQPVELQGAELLHRVAGEPGHGLGRVGLEHQSRGVRAGAARHGQLTAVEHGDVGPTAAGQLVGDGRPDHAGPDDDDPGAGHDAASSCSVPDRTT